MSKLLSSFLALASMGMMASSSHRGPSGEDIAEGLTSFKGFTETDRPLNDYSFTAGGMEFKCSATSRKDALTKFNVWKRKNKMEGFFRGKRR